MRYARIEECAGCEATHLELLAWEDAVGDLHLIERLIHLLASWSRCCQSLERSCRKSERLQATISKRTSRGGEPD